MSEFIDRDGNEITTAEWGKLFRDKSYKQVRLDWSRDKRVTVSTIWLGLRHGPLFESMVFIHVYDADGVETNYEEVTERYNTEGEAIAGHDVLVASHIVRPAVMVELEAAGGSPALLDGAL